MLNIVLGAVSLGLLWAIMTLGVFLTYRILDYADLTVEGSITMGAAIAARLIYDGVDPVLATAAAIAGGMAAGWVTGVLHTKLKIPGLLSGILSMIALYSINIRIMGKANITLLKSDTGRGRPDRRSDLLPLLVLRHRAGLCHPCHRRQ